MLLAFLLQPSAPHHTAPHHQIQYCMCLSVAQTLYLRTVAFPLTMPARLRWDHKTSIRTSYAPHPPLSCKLMHVDRNGGQNPRVTYSLRMIKAKPAKEPTVRIGMKRSGSDLEDDPSQAVSVPVSRSGSGSLSASRCRASSTSDSCSGSGSPNASRCRASSSSTDISVRTCDTGELLRAACTRVETGDHATTLLTPRSRRTFIPQSSCRN